MTRRSLAAAAARCAASPLRKFTSRFSSGFQGNPSDLPGLARLPHGPLELFRVARRYRLKDGFGVRVAVAIHGDFRGGLMVGKLQACKSNDWPESFH